MFFFSNFPFKKSAVFNWWATVEMMTDYSKYFFCLRSLIQLSTIIKPVLNLWFICFSQSLLRAEKLDFRAQRFLKNLTLKEKFFGALGFRLILLVCSTNCSSAQHDWFKWLEHNEITFIENNSTHLNKNVQLERMVATIEVRNSATCKTSILYLRSEKYKTSLFFSLFSVSVPDSNIRYLEAWL